MLFQVLGSGSRGNAALVRAGETTVLIDAGLPVRALADRLEGAHVGHRALDHILVSHGHLDHARSAGIFAKRHVATLHCPEKMRHNRSVSRAPFKEVLPVDGETTLSPRYAACGSIEVSTARLPHDCDPTLAFLVSHRGRRLGFVSDMGEPRESVAARIIDPHVLAIEANHDVDMLAGGPYPEPLRNRVAGAGGHLSNDQMAVMLTRLAGPSLHTVVLVHISEKNNTPELASRTARAALARMGRDDVRVECARQERSLHTIEV